MSAAPRLSSIGGGRCQDSPRSGKRSEDAIEGEIAGGGTPTPEYAQSVDYIYYIIAIIPIPLYAAASQFNSLDPDSHISSLSNHLYPLPSYTVSSATHTTIISTLSPCPISSINTRDLARHSNTDSRRQIMQVTSCDCKRAQRVKEHHLAYAGGG